MSEEGDNFILFRVEYKKYVIELSKGYSENWLVEIEDDSKNMLHCFYWFNSENKTAGKVLDHVIKVLNFNVAGKEG